MLPNPLRNRGIDPSLIDEDDEAEQAEEAFDDAPDNDSMLAGTTIATVGDLS